MSKYNVHFSGYYAYNIEVEAKNEDEAIDKAAMLFEDVDPNEFMYESTQEDVWEIKE